ncbi:MAG: hypothetical protein ACXVCP_05170 [Bdellovibrio sp.]
MKTESLYKQILEQIYAGFYEEASAGIRILREKNSFRFDQELVLMQNLLAARIALKSGNIPQNIESLTIGRNEMPFIAGEIHLVKGITNYQTGKMVEGISDYSSARKYFEKSGHKDKELLAWYNELIGCTHVYKKTLKEFLSDFRLLEIEAEKFNQNRILGLIQRQKSYFYKDAGKYNAALFEAEKSVRLLELFCAASDFHLGLLNVVDILIELNRHSEAMKYMELIIEPVDKRVQFPLAYLKNRLLGTELVFVNQEQSCPHFLYRYNSWKNSSITITEKAAPILDFKFRIDGDNTVVSFEGKEYILKKDCLEAKLIEILTGGPQGKNLICEKLWPEYAEIPHLDNRLHRLISRTNKKTDGLIVYSEKTYKLRVS